jgi:pyruvate/2-oxoglutarate/acetoin dehydrogenase E1 component
MVREAIAAAAPFDGRVEVWNPFVLQPLDLGPIAQSVERTGRLLVVQECGAVQGLGDRVISLLLRRGRRALKCRPKLIAAPDVPVPFAPELESYYRPDADKIGTAIEAMLEER